MKNAPDSEENILLNAALADDEWQTLSASLKHRSLQAFRGRRRLRRSLRGGLAAAAVLLAAAVAIWQTRHPAPAPATPHPVAAAPVQPTPGIPHMTDEQLLALFPKGSCAIVEIEGRKQLIFFDQKQADQGFLLSRQ